MEYVKVSSVSPLTSGKHVNVPFRKLSEFVSDIHTPSIDCLPRDSEPTKSITAESILQWNVSIWWREFELCVYINMNVINLDFSKFTSEISFSFLCNN